MSRKQVVLIEWIVLVLLAAGLIAFIVHALISRGGGGKQEKAAVEASGTGTQNEDETEETVQEPEPTPTPDLEQAYTLSFAGDCTIGSLRL